MRKYFIDNLRWISILLLFPYHTFMIYNNFGENFYVKGPGINLCTDFIYVFSPFYMPLLFLIAGISTRYALEKRSKREFLIERINKLLIPFIAGIILLVPIQTFFAEKYHNSYSGNYFEQLKLFFTKITDMTGYTGGFTPAQLWFILYLFIISILAIPTIILYNKVKNKIEISKISVSMLLPLFLVFGLMSYILDISGKSLGEFFALFMCGYLIISEDIIQEKLEKARWYLFVPFVVFTILNLILIHTYKSYLGDIYGLFHQFLSWLGILTCIAMGRKYLNFNNKITDYFSKASFPIYIIHQSVLVSIAYYTLKFTNIIVSQIAIIILLSFILTIVVYELFRHMNITRYLFAIKK